MHSTLRDEPETCGGLAAELAGAATAGQLHLAYQPLYALASGRIAAAEALLRWRHPDRGCLDPGVFLPAAEEVGLMSRIGAWALADACRQCRLWIDAGLPAPPVAVNVSPSQLVAPGFAAAVLAHLAQTCLPPYLLELEITESSVLAEVAEAGTAVRRLAARGVRFALDDFGTGYSSLRALQLLPVHRLKIAREFTRGVATSRADAAIVRSVIDLGHRLGLAVTAEGVESAAQAAVLRRLACDEAQGFYFSRPLPAAELTSRLAAARGRGR